MEQNVKKIAWYSLLTLIMVVVIGVIIYTKSDVENPVNLGSGADYKNASSTVYTNVAGQAVVLSPTNEGRGWAVVTNMTATAAYLALNATTSPNTVPILADTAYTILVPASTSYTFNENNRWVGPIIATSSAAVTLRFTEIY